MAHSHTRLSLVVLALAFALVPATARAADHVASPGTLNSVFASAQAGDRILLQAGSYGSFSGGQKPGTVTIRAEPGVAASMSLSLGGASNLRFEGLTITRADIASSARNIAMVGNTFTGTATVEDGPAMNILFDRNTHDNIDVCGSCAEGRISITGGNGNRTPNGVVITNSHFSGGNSDGVQTGGHGTQIGPGNEFENLMQASSVHTDPIQLYGSSSTHIIGNFLHDNTMTIMAPDGPRQEVIEHNVIVANHDTRAVNLGSDQGSVVRHNTLIGYVMYKQGNSGGPSTGGVIKDNVATQGVTLADGSSPAEENFNLVGSGGVRGANSLRGQPVFVGGAAADSFAGYMLAPGSPGKNAASDGTDMGASLSLVSPPAPAAPAPARSGPRAGGRFAGMPSVALLRPDRGAAVPRRLQIRARAADDSGIDTVHLWVDGRGIGVEWSAPYRWRARVPRGTHTITARAWANDGQIASAAVTVHRRSGRAAGRRARRGLSWRVASRPTAGGTVVLGKGPRRSSARVTLARCDDPAGKRVARVRLHANRKGKVRPVRRAHGLCVLRVSRG